MAVEAETELEDVIAQTIKDYFLDNHGFDTGYWEGFTAEWLDTGEFDALALAENIAERIINHKTMVLLGR